MIEIPLSKKGKYAGKYVTIVSDEDKDLADKNWIVFHNRDTNMYAKKRGNVWLHRTILERMLGRELEKGEFVDHRNRNGLDNRRENLRLATRQQNGANRKTTNSLGAKGVCREKNRFRAQIGFNKKRIRIGSYKTIEEASEAYKQKAKELFGEFAVEE